MLGGLAVVAVLLIVTPAAASPPTPLTLTVAIGSNLDAPPAGVAFAGAVRRLSKGEIVVVFRSTGLTSDSERLAIQQVRAGSAPMAWIPTRGWDTQGVKAFTALQAPLLVTDYALLRKVLTGEVARAMLGGTMGVGVRTLGLAAADLRLILGARKPFLAPADFRGAKIRVPAGSAVTSSILEALGAVPMEIASSADLSSALQDGTLDGAETSLGYILLNGYQRVASHVTTNLVLFPRVDSIAVNEASFRRLTSKQRSILARAAVETTTRSFAGLQARDQLQLRLLCGVGLKAASSSPADLAAVRSALLPVYATLQEHRPTAARIAQIRKLKKTTRPGAALRIPAGCAA